MRMNNLQLQTEIEMTLTNKMGCIIQFLSSLKKIGKSNL